MTTTSSTAHLASTPLSTAEPTRPHDIGLLLLRLVVGSTMAAHGAEVLFGSFGGPGLAGAARYFTSVGYTGGQVMAVVAGGSQFLGGLGLAVGLLTPLSGAAIVGTMINAVAVKWHGGFFIPTGFEYELTVATVAATLALSGPGRFAVDRLIPGLRTHRMAFGIVAVALGIALALLVLLTLRK
jgi:putative oxidoreductase